MDPSKPNPYFEIYIIFFKTRRYGGLWPPTSSSSGGELGALWAPKYSTVQYSTVQYSTVQYSTVQYSTVQYSTVQYSTVQYSTVQYSTVQYSTVQYSTVDLDTMHQLHCPTMPTGVIAVGWAL